MPSFGHRHLLRLRRLPRTTAPRVAPPPARTMSTGSTDMEAASSHLPPYLLRPSSIASSSKLTLDAFLNTGNEEDMITSALSFAAEDDLLAAALSPLPPNTDSKQWIDPAAAYLSLRSSGMFSHYLQLLLPRIRTLYANLRPTGMHQLLVSDLLLRNPNPRALREILQEEAQPAHPHTNSDNLRPGLVLQLFRIISPSMRRHVIPRLSRAALLSISRALRWSDKPESPELLTGLFHDLAATTNWEPEGMWPLLEIVLRLVRSGHQKEALTLLQYPIQLGKLPQDAFGRTPPNHERAADLMVQSTVIRTLLSWGFDKRAMKVVNELVDTMINSSPADSGLELVLVACRVAALSVNRESARWSQETLLRLANDDRFPPLASADINLQLDALPTPEALAFYSALSERHAPPSPRHILRLAFCKPTRELSRRLAIDISRTPEDATAAIPGVLCAFASARMLLLSRAAYESWDARAKFIDAHTTLTLVSAFTRGSRSAKNTEFALTVLNDYLNTSGARLSAVEASVTALHAYGLIGAKANSNGSDPAAEHVEVLVSALGRSGALARLKAMTEEYPLLAHRLTAVGASAGLVLPPAALTIAASCAARHWGSLSAASSLPLTKEEDMYLRCLASARKSRKTSALQRFKSAVAEFPTSPMIAPTAAALLHRLGAMQAWAEGAQVVIATPADTDIAEAAAAFLAALAREAAGAPAESAAECADTVAAKVEQEGKAETEAEMAGQINIYVDALGLNTPAPAIRAHEALVAAQAAGRAEESRDAARAAWETRGASILKVIARMDPMRRTLLETVCEGFDACEA